MKNFIKTIAVVVTALIFATGCEKGSDKISSNQTSKNSEEITGICENNPLKNNPVLKDLNKDFTYFYYSCDNSENVLYGLDFLDVIKWNHRVDEKEVFDAKTTLDYSDISDIKVISYENNKVLLQLDKNTIVLENFEENNGFITYDSQLPDGRIINYGFYSSGINLNTLNNLFKENDIIKNPFTLNQPKGPWIIAIVGGIVGVATMIVYEEISDYCIRTRENQARLCTEQGKCFTINRCSATCRECGNL